METDINILIIFDKVHKIIITPFTDINEQLMYLKNLGIDILDNDPDNSIISRKIYQFIYKFYNENTCRGDTMNTCNSTFGTNNYRILDIINKQNISEENKIKIMNKIDEFRHIFYYIGNFTVLECSHKNSINTARGSYWGKLRDSWPLTLLCIQDYLSNYSLIEENPIKYSFETKEAQTFFQYYSESENGFEKFCDDHYLSQKFYNNSSDLAYVKELSNGKYEVNLDLFDGLSLSKPLPMNIVEIEQYIDRVTKKIIARGKIMLQKYMNNNI